MSRPRFNEQAVNTFVRGIEALTLEMRTLRAAVDAAPEKLRDVIAEQLNDLRVVQAAPAQLNLALADQGSEIGEPGPALPIEGDSSQPPPIDPQYRTNPDDEIIPPPRPVTGKTNKDGTSNAVLWALAYLGIRDEDDMVRRLMARGYEPRKIRAAITAYLASEMFTLSRDQTLIISGPARHVAKERARIYGVDKAALARGITL